MSEQEEVARERVLQKDYQRIWLPPPVRHDPMEWRWRGVEDSRRSGALVLGSRGREAGLRGQRLCATPFCANPLSGPSGCAARAQS
jgi:hypothetical protein